MNIDITSSKKVYDDNDYDDEMGEFGMGLSKKQFKKKIRTSREQRLRWIKMKKQRKDMSYLAKLLKNMNVHHQ